MRRRRRMNGEAARVADIGDVIKKFETIDERRARLAAPGEFKADEAAIFAVQIFVGARPLAPALRRMDDPRHLRRFRR